MSLSKNRLITNNIKGNRDKTNLNNVFISKITAGKEWLKKLVKIGVKIDLIITLKNNNSSDACSFDDISEEFNIPLIKTDNVNSDEIREKIEEKKPDIIWVLGWSKIIGKDILDIPNIGTIGSHPTELPKYRGRAPIPWSIIKGLEESALTFFWLDEDIDKGPILIQKNFKIDLNDTALDVYKKMIKNGNEMLEEVYAEFEKGNYPQKKQNKEEFIEEWPKRTPKDSEIDWSKSLIDIHNQIRAVSGIYPWAYSHINDKKILFKKSRYKDGKLIIEEAEII